MTEQSSVINAELDNIQNNIVDENQNVEQTITENVELQVEASVTPEVAEVIEAEVTPEVAEVIEAEVAPEVAPEAAAVIEAEVAPEVPVATEAPTAAVAVATAKPEAEKAVKQRQEISAEVMSKLKTIRESGNTISAKVEDRVRGGLRLSYEDAPLFLPTSHFSLKPNPTEDELIQSVGAQLEVEILEINEDLPSHKRNIIVSRKRLLEDRFWNEINEGDIIEGPVTSITTFGIFIDVGGFEGLVHISRMSRKRIDSTKSFAKKGDKFRAVVVEVDKNKKRIGLSIAELEPSLWDGVVEKFPLNSLQKVTVKRFVDFGAIVELAEGVQGIIRNPDLSWTRRVTNPKDVLELEQVIDAQVMSVNPDKELFTLSYKHTLHNPWSEIEKELKIGDEKEAIVRQVKPEGAILSINDIDGFMPMSKMGKLSKGKKVPFKKGDKVLVVISDLVPAHQSLILEPKEDPMAKAAEREDRGNRGRQKWENRPSVPQQVEATTTEVGSFSFSDMLGEDAMKKLFGN
jgi:small subunit ribosomal protein S1